MTQNYVGYRIGTGESALDEYFNAYHAANVSGDPNSARKADRLHKNPTIADLLTLGVGSGITSQTLEYDENAKRSVIHGFVGEDEEALEEIRVRFKL